MHTSTMGFVENFLDELIAARDSRFGGVNQKMAKAAEYDPTNLGRILRGEKTSWLSSLGRLADAAGLVVTQKSAVTGGDYAFIQIAEAKPSAGGGSLETSGKTEGSLAFRRDWLGSKTRTSPERLRVMFVAGDSMSPTIAHGDVVLVDEGGQGKELSEGKVYVIRKGDEIFVKRYRRGVGKQLFLGDNRETHYNDVEVLPGEEDGFEVIGRVLWAGKEL